MDENPDPVSFGQAQSCHLMPKSTSANDYKPELHVYHEIFPKRPELSQRPSADNTFVAVFTTPKSRPVLNYHPFRLKWSKNFLCERL